MENIKQEDIVKKPLPSDGQEEGTKKEPEQDPLKTELDKIKSKGEGRTKKEKLIYTKNRVEQQLRELGEEEGTQPEPEVTDDDAPVTVGMLKKIQAEQTVKTALQMAEDIESETERELTIYHINNTIKSTGNPAEDLRLARAIVNASKNSKIIEEATRRSQPKTHSGASSAPANFVNDQEIELTAEELAFTKAPFNMKPADIIKTRK